MHKKCVIWLLYLAECFTMGYDYDKGDGHKKKPRLHNGTVMEDMDKYRVVRIPPSGHEPPDVSLTRIRKAPRTQPS